MTSSNSCGVIVWCAMLLKGIIGLYFFVGGSVTGESYNGMLRGYFFSRMKDNNNDTIFQHDCAARYYAIQFRSYVERKFPNRWTGRDGSIC